MSTETNRMGYEAQIFYGAAGSTAGTLLENARDVAENGTTSRGNTTRRGDSSGPPMETESVTRLITSITFQMLNDSTDAALEAMLEAEAAGTPVALRVKNYPSGKGFDGDCYLEASKPYPLDGEQVIDFTATPTRDGGRAPSRRV